MRLTGTNALVIYLMRGQPTGRTVRCSGESPGAAASGCSGVEPLDLGGEVSRDVGQFPERARDRAQSDPFEGLAELGDRCVEAVPKLERTRARPRAGAQLMGELHVPGARVRTMREAELIGVAQGGGLLLGRVGDRAHALGEAMVRRRFNACLQCVSPTLVGELHLFESDTGIASHDCSAGSKPTVMMWSAICRGAAVREASVVRGARRGGGFLADVRRRGV